MRRVSLLLAALAVAAVLAGCDPVKGGQCSHPGDVWSGHGHTLTCGRSGTWQ